MNKQIRKLDCGCINEEKTTKNGYIRYTIIKELKICKKHKDLKIKQEKEKKEFEKFPNKKSKRIFKILEEMIGKLYDNGVDVSYFPKEAEKTLKQYAIKIEKLIN